MLQRNEREGSCLLVAFDPMLKVYKAIGRRSQRDPLMIVEKETFEVRELLLALRPLLRKMEKFNLLMLLRKLTRTTTLRWSDALHLIFGNLVLEEAAMRRMWHLPSSYLKQHAPQSLYTFVTLNRVIPRNENRQRKKSEPQLSRDDELFT